VNDPISLRTRTYAPEELYPGYDRLRLTQSDGGVRTHIVLFLLTFLSTALASALNQGFNPLAEPAHLVDGLPYAAALMTILLFHESGHYILARLYRVPTSLPYFIPAPPFFLLGTFGAVIRMRTLPRDRRALFDVGAAGPWAGIAIAIPVLVLGLSLSEVYPRPEAGAGLILGEPLLFRLLSRLVLGVSSSGDVTILLHPLALAGWAGLLVTMLNLLPIGQLDGGHVLYAALGPRWHYRVSLGIVAVLVVLGVSGAGTPLALPVMAAFFVLRALLPPARHLLLAVATIVALIAIEISGSGSWLVWAILMSVIGLRHPPLLDTETPLDTRRRIGAIATLVLFVFTFMPAPITLSTHRHFVPPRPDAVEVHTLLRPPVERSVPL